MKITCEKCATPIDFQEAVIPPSGVMMRCPACLHTFKLRPESQAKKPDAPPLELQLEPEAELPAPKRPAPRPRAPEITDLPAPVARPKGITDLPAPVARPRGITDLPAPVSADLPAPVSADLPAPVSADLPEPVGADVDVDGLELDDLPPPPTSGKGPVRPVAELSEQVGEDVAEQLTQPLEGAGGEALEGSTEDGGLVTGDGLDLDSAISPIIPSADGAAQEKKEEPKPRSRRRILLYTGAVLALLAVVGAGGGYFLLLQSRQRTPDEQADVAKARQLLQDGLVPSYIKSAERLQELTAKRPHDIEALALLAQAQFAQAYLGATTEKANGERTLGKINDKQNSAEVRQARALRDLVGNNPLGARRALTTIMHKAVENKDPLTPLYMSWVEIKSGKPNAALAPLQTVLQIKPKMPAALFTVAQAKEAMKDPAAAEAYQDVLKARPEHFGAALGLCRVTEEAANEGRLLEAIGKHKNTASPGEVAEAWTLLASRALSTGRRKETEEYLRKALQTNPGLFGAQVSLARLLCDKEKYQEAQELAAKAFKADAKNLEAGLVLMRAQLGNHALADAHTTIAALEKLDPKDARVLYFQGRYQEALGAADNIQKAEGYYRKAHEADLRYLDAYIALARVLSQQGKNTEAMATLKQAAEQTQGDPDLANSLGEAYVAVNEHEKAVGVFRIALEKKPAFNKARMNLSQSLEHLGRLGEAEAELRAIEKEDPNFPGLAGQKAELLLKEGHYKEAEAAYLEAIKKPGASEGLRLAAARCLGKAQPRQAEELLEGILKENPRSGDAYAALALLKLEQNQITDAAVAADRAYRLIASPETLLAKGTVLLLQNRRVEGIALLEQARRPPVEGKALALHAKYLAAAGRNAQALEELIDLTNRQKALFADRAVYRPEEVDEIMGNAYLLLAELAMGAQKEELSHHAYAEAARLLPQSGEAAFQNGRSLYMSGKRPVAIKEILRALALGGANPPYALESYLLLGDSYREKRQRAEALHYYQKWLDSAPPNAPERHEVELHMQHMGPK